MSKYRHHLPQTDGDFFLTDGGLETTLVFHDKLDLPAFAAIVLVHDEQGRQRLRDYFNLYIDIARRAGAGFILEAPTWRSNTDWGLRIGYTEDSLAAANREAIRLLGEIREARETSFFPIVVSGCIGPRGDGYDPGDLMSPDEAEGYHAAQIAAFREAGADMATGITITSASEAIGIVRAARKADMPVAMSFTVETDGRLPTGQSLWEAIAEVDAATDTAAAYYMINCAHPTHFAGTLAAGGELAPRLRGLRANASCLSHAELDNSEELDTGNPAALGREYAGLLARHPHINVLGGCCGTDHRHIEQIAIAGAKRFRKAA